MDEVYIGWIELIPLLTTKYRNIEIHISFV